MGESTMKKPKYRDGRATNRPPDEYKFKKGMPSRRKGRRFPKPPPSAKQLFRKIAAEKIVVIEGNLEIKLTRFSACVRRFQLAGLNGDMPAMHLFNKFREAFPGASEDGPFVVYLADERELDV
jgi:hypothetical protein